MYKIIAVLNGQIVRLKRAGDAEANRTAQILRDKGWIVCVTPLSCIGASLRLQ